MPTAWMIRNDGQAFPCVQHIYADFREVEETLAAAQWLHTHTRHKENRLLALRTVAAWAAGLPFAHGKDAIERVVDAIASRPYRFLSAGFVSANAAEIAAIPTAGLDLAALCRLVQAELNQEFLRARYGGMYSTAATSREMVFRISSAGFNWYGIIRRFLADTPLPVDTVTVVRDEESTGAVDGFYRNTQGGVVYRRLPLAAFLGESGDVELTIPKGNYTALTLRILTELGQGASLQQLQGLPMNAGRIRDKLEVLQFKENRFACGNNPLKCHLQ